MNTVQGFTVGRITRGGTIVRPDGKKPFVTCTIEHVRYWNDKEFKNRVELISYRDIDELEPRLTPGNFASASGDVSVNRYKHNDKEYYNLRIVGTITPIVMNQPSATQPDEQKTSPIDDDDVPF